MQRLAGLFSMLSVAIAVPANATVPQGTGDSWCGPSLRAYQDELVSLCHPVRWSEGGEANPRPGTRRYHVFVGKDSSGAVIGSLEVIHLDLAGFPPDKALALAREPERTLLEWVVGTLAHDEMLGRYPPATPQPAVLGGLPAAELHLRDLSSAGIKDVLTITATRVGETALIIVEAIDRYNPHNAASMAFSRDLSAARSTIRVKAAAAQADVSRTARPSRERAATRASICAGGSAANTDFIVGEWRATIGGTAFSGISRLDETGTIEVGLRFRGDGTYESGVMYRGFAPQGSWRSASSGRYELCASGDRARPWLLMLTPHAFEANSKVAEEVLVALSLPHGRPLRFKVRPIADFIHYLDFLGEQSEAWSAHRSAPR